MTGWIPITPETLPEEWIQVYVWVETRDGQTWQGGGNYFFGDLEDPIALWTYDNSQVFGTPTHWRPQFLSPQEED